MKSIYTNPGTPNGRWLTDRETAIGLMVMPRCAGHGDHLIGEGGKKIAVVSRTTPEAIPGGRGFDFQFTQTVSDLDGNVLISQAWKMTDRGVFRA